MNLLLDTCTLIWMDGQSSQLSPTAKALLSDPTNPLFMSVTSVWEIVHKHKIGKLPLWGSPKQVLNSLRQDYGVQPLGFHEDDAQTLGELDMLHRDPFDLMLICQAKNRGLTLVTPDPAIRQYPIPVLW